MRATTSLRITHGFKLSVPTRPSKKYQAGLSFIYRGKANSMRPLSRSHTPMKNIGFAHLFEWLSVSDGLRLETPPVQMVTPMRLGPWHRSLRRMPCCSPSVPPPAMRVFKTQMPWRVRHPANPMPHAPDPMSVCLIFASPLPTVSASVPNCAVRRCRLSRWLGVSRHRQYTSGYRLYLCRGTKSSVFKL